MADELLKKGSSLSNVGTEPGYTIRNQVKEWVRRQPWETNKQILLGPQLGPRQNVFLEYTKSIEVPTLNGLLVFEMKI